MKDYKKIAEEKFPNLEILEIFKKDTLYIKFKCKKHGEQIRRYFDFKDTKYGCSGCGYENKKHYTKTKEQFIKEAQNIHGDKYDYSNFEYKNENSASKIFCKKHQTFFIMTPHAHIGQKQNCPICANEKKGIVKSLNRWKNIKEELNFDNYEYIDFDNVFDPLNIHKKINIKCKQCGTTFNQDLFYHIHGRGCPECGKKSYGEKIINSFLENKGLILNQTYFREKKFDDLRSGKGGNDFLRFDFYIPEKNTVIEFNGRQHYQELNTFYKTHQEFLDAMKRDQMKRDYCKSKGILELEIQSSNIKELDEILEEWYIKEK